MGNLQDFLFVFLFIFSFFFLGKCWQGQGEQCIFIQQWNGQVRYEKCIQVQAKSSCVKSAGRYLHKEYAMVWYGMEWRTPPP